MEPLLKAGHFLPPYMLPNQNAKPVELQLYAGRPLILFFMPLGFPDYTDDFLAYRAARQSTWNHCQALIIFVAKASPEECVALYEKMGSHFGVMADEDGALHQAFAPGKDPLRQPISVVFGVNLRIEKVIMERNGQNNLAEALRSVPPAEALKKELLITKPHPPVMVIPEAISQELVEELREYWHTGNKYTGTIGVGGGEVVNNQGKRRTDVNVDSAELLRKVDQHISYSVLPEIKKVTNVQITCRERYKLGCYGSENKGYYNFHRDTGVRELAFRRYSMSVMLNEEYEGGRLVFSEYDNAHYQLPARSAIVFPSTLLHGVTPVTAGERFMMVAFMFGDAEEEYRKKVIMEEGGKYNRRDVELLCSPTDTILPKSEYFYTKSSV